MTSKQNMSDIDIAQQIDQEDEEDEEKDNARKIGPFTFDIDDDIDTEVLTNEQVYDDLKELDDIIDERSQDRAAINLNLGKTRKKRRA